jgi:hypothetical protein
MPFLDAELSAECHAAPTGSGATLAGFGEDFVHGEHFSFLVGATGPEKATKAVLAFARNDMDMEVRDALADDVVHGDEAAVCLHCCLHFAGEQLCVGEKRADQSGGEIRQSGVVRFRNQQDVAGEKRANVEEGDGDFVFENNFGFEFSRNDFAEQAGLVLGYVFLFRFLAGARFSHPIRLIPSGRLERRS